MITRQSTAQQDMEFLDQLHRQANPELARAQQEAITKWGSIQEMGNRALEGQWTTIAQAPQGAEFSMVPGGAGLPTAMAPQMGGGVQGPPVPTGAEQFMGALQGGQIPGPMDMITAALGPLPDPNQVVAQLPRPEQLLPAIGGSTEQLFGGQGIPMGVPMAPYGGTVEELFGGQGMPTGVPMPGMPEFNLGATAPPPILTAPNGYGVLRSPEETLAYNQDQPEWANFLRDVVRAPYEGIGGAAQGAWDFFTMPSRQWRGAGSDGQSAVGGQPVTPPSETSGLDLIARNVERYYGAPGTAPGTSTEVSAEAQPVVGDWSARVRQGESGGNYQAQNELDKFGDPAPGGGYSGAYQFGEEMAKTIGAYTGDENLEDNIWHGTFTLPRHGQMTYEEWLNSPGAQDETQELNDAYLQSQIYGLGLDQYIGTEFQGVPVTMDSLKAGAHIAGLEGMRRALETGQEEYDGNGTPVSKWMALGVGDTQYAPDTSGSGYVPPSTEEVMGVGGGGGTAAGGPAEINRWLDMAAPQPAGGLSEDDQRMRLLMGILGGVAAGGLGGGDASVGQMLLNMGLGGVAGLADTQLGAYQEETDLSAAQELQRQQYALSRAGVAADVYGSEQSTALAVAKMQMEQQQQNLENMWEQYDRSGMKYMATLGDGGIVMQVNGPEGPRVEVIDPVEMLRRTDPTLISGLWPEGEGPVLNPQIPQDLLFAIVRELDQRGMLGQVFPEAYEEALEDAREIGLQQAVDPELQQEKIQATLYGTLMILLMKNEQLIRNAAAAGSPTAQFYGF